MYVCMYINILTPRRVGSFFEFLSLYTHLYRYRLINRCQRIPVRFSGPELVAPHLESALDEQSIVVVRTPYIWGYVSVLPYR